MEDLDELVVLCIGEFSWFTFAWIVVDDLLDRLGSEPVEPIKLPRQPWAGVSVALSNVRHRRVVLFEIVDHRHHPLCRLLAPDLRESIAEVFEGGGVK